MNGQVKFKKIVVEKNSIKMMYLLLTADSFRESMLKELGHISKYRIIAEHNNIFIVDMAIGKERKLDKAAFIYGYFPICNVTDLDSGEYINSIYNGIKKLGTDKGVRTKIECFDINCKEGYSAKDIEVAIGTRMERDGYNVDIVNPGLLAYAVLLDSTCYAGYIRLGKGRRGFIDTFRFYKHKEISRSEFKLVEAFNTFRPPVPGVAIDIGAAPGGWSLFLAKSGAAVIAIDNAELEYGKIINAGIDAVALKDTRGVKIGKGLRQRQIIHLKCGFQKAEKCLDGKIADMLTIDINAGGIASSGAVLRYSRFMKKGAYLIMTVKCIMRSVGKYMREVEGRLGGRFEVLQWKVLPHNRQEITLFARKR